MTRSTKALSLDLRSRLVDAVHEQKLSVTEAARRLMIPASTARSFLRHYKETGQAEPKKKGGNRRPLLTEEHLDWIQTKLDNKSDMRLSDLHHEMQKEFNFDNNQVPSISSFHRAITTKLQYTLKLLKVEPADYNHPARIRARQDWALAYNDSGVSLFNAVYIDESGFNLQQHISYGRAKRDERAINVVPSDREQNVSYIAAIGSEGVIADWAHQGGTTGKLFAWFLMVKVFPKLQQQTRQIIMDNAKIHHSRDVKAAFAESPHLHQVFLPPYSPFLNIAKCLFGYAKPRLSKEEYKDTNSLFQAIRNSASTVTPERAVSWIKEANRNLIRSVNGEVLGREQHYNMREGDEVMELLEDFANGIVIA